MRLTTPPWRHALLTLPLAWLVIGSVTLHAYPPAPYYTIYGIVRDQVGASVNTDGAEIVLLRDGQEVTRAPVFPKAQIDFNYELKIRIDQARAGSRIYSTSALAPTGTFSLKVVINGQDFYPIEANGTLRTGVGGERVRLDLNLGADKNGDGLPDAWQEWVLYQAGRRPGGPGWDINLITKDGDFDGDGISNFQEYVAGTFAGDATDRFELRLTQKTATDVALEFFAITGKVYGIEESADLQTWKPITFTPPAGTTTVSFYQAPAVGVTTVRVAAPASLSRFYRLTAR
jgi:hypothetical protein